jgi:hypothetical protein
MRLTMNSNLADVGVRVRSIGKQAVFAASVALTRAAKDAQAAIIAEMRDSFIGPTAYALGGTVVKGANKNNLEARVWVKDNPFGKGTPADRFLSPQIYGGKRGQKGMEKLLVANAMMPAGWFAVPAVGAQLDANGNVKRSQIVQILSQLQIQRTGGFQSRATGSARSARTIARQGVTYFALPKAERGLKPGIYLKRKFALGTAIRPVFIFVPSTQYRQRLKFFEVGHETAERRFRYHFDIELAKAMSSARL